MARMKGFTLTDLLVAMVIAALLAALAVPAYDNFVERAKVARAVGDIGSISLAIDAFELKNNGATPLTLDELPIEVPDDPWGNPYQYFNIVAAGPGKGGFRKDGKLNPLNTDYDLYSIGRDGDTTGPLSAQASRDDVVRANNGAYIGLGEDY